MKSLVKTDYDSQFCGNVPLNFVNTIQDYGVLMVIEKESLVIRQVSENSDQLIGINFQDILNKNFLNIVASSDKEELQKAFMTVYSSPHFVVNFRLDNNISCIATVHSYERQFIVEVEPMAKQSGFSHIYQEIKNILEELSKTSTSAEACSLIAKELKRFSGFDKVLIYQFDSNWNGFVVAEEKEPDMDSYMDLHFPASDIPRQARNLYLKNPYRLIPDAGYDPVKLNPVLNPITFTFTDLSDCNLRSVPAVHIEYLGNMRVASSMSTPIIKDNELWGLISCHHKTPKIVSFDARSAFVLVSSVFSTELSSKEMQKELKIALHTTELQSEIAQSLMPPGSLADHIMDVEEKISELLKIDGFILIYKDKIYSSGYVFSEEHLKEMIFWLKINQVNDIYSSNELPFKENIAYGENDPCGFLAIPINFEKGDFFIGFRREMKHIIKWGGNPNEAIRFEKDQKAYHPRNSFTVWQETVGNSCANWEIPTLESAKKLQAYILKNLGR